MLALRRAINGMLAGALTIVSFSCGASPPERLGWISVEANAYLGPQPIYLGSPGEYEFTSSGDIQPDDGGWNNAPQPLCSMLAAMGRPKDCDRTLASGMFSPTPMAGYWSYYVPGTWAEIAPQTLITLNSIAGYLNYPLAGCYSNPSQNPRDCEDQYLSEFSANCAWLGYVDPFDPNNYPETNPHELCEQGVDAASGRVTLARANRWIADWYGLQVTGQWGPFELNLNVDIIAAVFNDNFNALLILSRRYDACSKWYNVWDSQSCNSAYPGF